MTQVLLICSIAKDFFVVVGIVCCLYALTFLVVHNMSENFSTRHLENNKLGRDYCTYRGCSLLSPNSGNHKTK